MQCLGSNLSSASRVFFRCKSDMTDAKEDKNDDAFPWWYKAEPPESGTWINDEPRFAWDAWKSSAPLLETLRTTVADELKKADVVGGCLLVVIPWTPIQARISDEGKTAYFIHDYLDWFVVERISADATKSCRNQITVLLKLKSDGKHLLEPTCVDCCHTLCAKKRPEDAKRIMAVLQKHLGQARVTWNGSKKTTIRLNLTTNNTAQPAETKPSQRTR